ncbi:MAG: SIR2 family protein [Parvibaculum sp.]|uniref:P-loop NTPase n=1 Tax=Parvibaculum sp. TaxID=2024848 RepID=UPI002ABBC531|nr:SIR2 family protein [Parvibaculum sp.]MDZ4379915.1 SIR2 family protein [Parvibaculum sp.]
MVDPTTEDTTASDKVLVEIPLGLRQSLEGGSCVLFVGAGIGRHLLRNGEGTPDGTALARSLAQDFKIDLSASPPSLPKVAQIVELRKGRPELDAYLQKRLCDLKPDEAFRWISTIRWKAIYTTNYDDGIEQAYAQTATPPQTPVPIALTSGLTTFDNRFQVPIYYLHGKACGAEKTRVIITENDYAEFRKQRQMMFEILKTEFATSPFLYIGYSNQDPNWAMLLEELRSEFYPSQLPQSYRVAPTTDALDEEILKSKNVDTIPCTYDDFQKSAAIALAGSTIPPDTLSRIQASVPLELLPAFEGNPAAVARLLNSWEYVNRAPYAEKPNTYDFYRGDKANWSLIAKGISFERDLEEEVYDSILDYATGSAKAPATRTVLAPAGYGTTTLLRKLAVRLVNDRAGHVFMHRESAPFLQGDIEFAASLFPDERPFFIIDNPADHQHDIYATIHRLRDIEKPALFLMGERLNEWRYARRGKAPGREFEIEPLSDPEISRLLDCLEANGELNALADLSSEFRIAAIKQNYQKELLVTLREATEGKAFDAILEDEFRSIPTDTARRFYLIVCCFYQHGALVRDNLLADMLKISLTDMYAEISEATAGVVVFEEIDPSYGHHAARARHRKIAAVVWERCTEPAERDGIILDALSRLNLNYRADAQAFENFIRSDRLVDSIRTLEDRIRFFEQACQKDPTSPYVRQHYARMLGRADQYSLALSQIDEGLKADSKIRVLHHTRGLILHQIAMKTESLEIARRRLAQSEDEFRYCINEAPKDEYAYQGLADLYVDWAQRVGDSAESTDYFAKAEEVIASGLKHVRVRDGLWLVSAKIQSLLGNEPKRMANLIKAASGPTDSIIPKYILGRAYREAGDPQASADLLRSVLEAHPDEYRICIEYALAMEALGESYPKCIAVLNLSTLYGFSDPKFIATLGGMLFLNGDFSDAKEVFDHSHKREFPAPEASRVNFRPRDPHNLTKPLEFIGRVTTVKTGYAFVSAQGYPPFFCPGSKFGRLLMRPNLMVQFEVVFNAKGPTMDNVRVAAS